MNFLNTEEYKQPESINHDMIHDFNSNNSSIPLSSSNNINTHIANYSSSSSSNRNEFWRFIVTSVVVSLLCFIIFDFCYYYFYGAQLWESQLYSLHQQNNNHNNNNNNHNNQTFQNIATVSPALQSSLSNLNSSRSNFKSYLQYRFMPFYYIFMTIILVVFIVIPCSSSDSTNSFQSIWKTFLISSLLGLCIYVTFQFKNASMIYNINSPNNNLLQLMLIDIIWGTILFGITGVITFTVAKTFDITSFQKY